MNKNALRAKIALHGDNYQTLAKALNMTTVSLSRKINGKRPFQQFEIQKIIDLYNLTADEVQSIFFTQNVS